MPEKQVSLDQSTWTVLIQDIQDSLPNGFVSIGSYEHGSPDDLEDSAINHVTYHHIREILYHYGLQDMHKLKIIDQLGNILPVLPEGFAYFTDENGAFYKDADGNYLYGETE